MSDIAFTFALLGPYEKSHFSGSGIRRRRALAFLFAHPATAQFSDMLKKGQDMLGGSSGGSSSGAASALSTGDIASGLKEALRVGSDRVVSQVGATDGYNKDPAIHLPLPSSLKTVQSALKGAGMSGMLDDLELKLNRAAEAAAPKARKLFTDAIADMSIDDARKIYDGPKDAATQLFPVEDVEAARGRDGAGRQPEPLGGRRHPVL